MSLGSKSNIDFLSSILNQFFLDKYNAQFPLGGIQAVVTDFISKMDPSLAAKYSLEELNKRVISSVKDILKTRLAARTAAPSAPPQAPTQQASPLPPLGLPPSLGPSSSQIDEDNDEGDEGESFMDKLQQLEIQRSLATGQQGNKDGGAAAGGGAGLDVGALRSMTDVLGSKVAPMSTTGAAGAVTATVFLQPPIKRGKEFAVRSWDRPWTMESARARNGVRVSHVPFIRDTSTQILFAYLPRSFCATTPYVVLQIQGATGQIFQSYLFPEVNASSGSACGGPWVALRPGSKSLGYVTPLALPWTVSFLEADGSVLDMGTDGQWLEYDTEQRMHRFSGNGGSRAAQGDVLWAYVGNELKRTRVIETKEDCLRIEGIHKSCQVLDYGKQWNIIFEISTTKSK